LRFTLPMIFFGPAFKTDPLGKRRSDGAVFGPHYRIKKEAAVTGATAAVSLGRKRPRRAYGRPCPHLTIHLAAMCAVITVTA
jgi:hypothetical protein